MRNAVNNLQSTYSGFGYVNAVRASAFLSALCVDERLMRNHSTLP